MQLLMGAKIHNVFHVALLKKFVLGDVIVSTSLPIDLVEIEDNLQNQGGEEWPDGNINKHHHWDPTTLDDFVLDYWQSSRGENTFI